MRFFLSLFLTFLILPAPLCSASQTGLDDGTMLVASQPTNGSKYFTVESTIFTVLDGVSNIRPDLVLSKDNQLVVFGDIYLDPTTNVEEIYPERARPDGRYYVIDFSFAELKGLQYRSQEKAYLMSFEELLALLKRLEKRTGTVTGIFPRLIKTWFHRQQGRDLCGISLTVLKQYGYFTHQAPVYLESYDTDELKRAHETLMPMMQTDIKLIQLIGSENGDEMMTDGPFPSPYSYDWIFTGYGLRSLATYVDGIEFTWHPLESEKQINQLADLFDNAAKLKLTLHAEINRDSLPAPAEEATGQVTVNKLLDTLANRLKVKTIETDRIIEAKTFFDSKQSHQPTIQELLPQLTNRGQGQEAVNPVQSPLTILRELQ